MEGKIRKYAIKNGWLTFKMYSQHQKGLPDRIFLKNGQCLFMEFKRKNKGPTELQQEVMDMIKAQNFEVHVIDDYNQAVAIL